MTHLSHAIRIPARSGNLLSVGSLLNPLMWLDPSPQYITLATTKVATWANRGTGGSTWDVAQATDANRPTYQATGGRYGGGAVLFVAATVTWLMSGATALNQPTTVIVISKSTSKINNSTIVDGRNGAGARRIFYSTLGDTYIQAGAFFASGAGDITDGVWYKYGGVFNGASSINRRDGTAASGDAGAGGGTGIVIGAGSSAGANPWDGTIEHVLLYGSALTNDQLTTIFARLG